MTLAEATTLRAAWMAAELAVATGQEYTIAGRTLKRADAIYIGKRVAYYDSLCAKLAIGGAGRGVVLKRAIPRDL